MRTSLSPPELRDAYRFPRFLPNRIVVEVHGDDHARVITLRRRAKKRRAARVARCTAPRTITACDLPCGDLRIYLEVAVRRVACRTCGRVRQERLDWLAANPHYTRRFALYVGKQCRGASVKEVATDLRLDWHAAKEMYKLYMREQLARAGPIAPAIIGIDKLSIRRGHVYRIVVSDLERGQPLWFGGVDRSEASLAMFMTSSALSGVRASASP